jgi:uncharacterized protein YhbP (UPF0306 family)
VSRIDTNTRTQQAREIVDANQSMVLGTAADTGQPWASPVWFAHDDYNEFVWVSSPAARHSRNIAERPQVGIVIFNSQVPIGAGQGVYLACEASVVSEADLDRLLDVFNRRSLAVGGKVLARSAVEAPSGEFRLYRAVASEVSMLAKDGEADHRVRVQFGEPERR